MSMFSRTIPGTSEQVLMPLADPERVDMRRKEVGLGPLAEYMSRFGLEWDAEAYQQRLPELEKAFFEEKEEHDH